MTHHQCVNCTRYIVRERPFCPDCLVRILRVMFS